MSSPRKILVTAALPYANGHIHLGHLVEYIQTDIWVRFQKLRGHNCRFFCADDTHGTAIMLRARQEGRGEESLIADMRDAHLRDFTGFDIAFDHYSSTHSDSNRAVCHEIWKRLRAQGLIVEQSVSQLYDVSAGTFLADRFVKGTCPKCDAPDQYGDNCEKCGATYSPADLKNPVSSLSGTVPELRSAVHLFIRIEAMHSFLEEWTQSGKHLQPEIANYLRGHFLGEPLRDWDVSRPAPYFGFEIPDSPGQYWYVWFDAPIGYIGSMTEWCNQSAQDPLTWWNRGEAGSEVEGEAEIHHFIGKDIAYFHTLFWPAVLRAAGFQLPSHVHIHGFLTVNGEKMSKSKGTFIRASTYLQHLDPAYLRYYYATKSTPKLDDLDLSFADFIDKVNADLVGKVVNLASRTARFVHQTGLSAEDFRGADGGLFEQAAADADSIAAAYEARDYNTAMRTIMLVADRANRYVDEEAPWTLRKDPGKAAELQQVCTVALNLFRQIAVFLTPVLPRLADQTGSLLNSPIHNWDEVKTPLLGTPVGAFEHMMKRVDEKQVAALVSESAETVPPSESESESDPVSESESESESESDTSAAATDDSPEALAAEPLSPEVNIDEFNKVDLRVARVLEAKEVKESNRLLQLTVTLGGDHRRSIFAGIKGVYRPEQLVGRLVIICANLAPRKMKFGTSEGMVLAAGPGGKDIFILAPDSGAKPGQRVH